MESAVNQGKVLKSLYIRAKADKEITIRDLQEALGIGDYRYCYQLFAKKELTANIIDHACKYFNVSPDVFYRKPKPIEYANGITPDVLEDPGVKLPSREELMQKIIQLQDENMRLKEELLRMDGVKK